MMIKIILGLTFFLTTVVLGQRNRQHEYNAECTKIEGTGKKHAVVPGSGCHRFISCHKGISYGPLDCPTKTLFSVGTDRCEDQEDVICNVLLDSNTCKPKHMRGSCNNYTECSNNKETPKNCGVPLVYSLVSNACVRLDSMHGEERRWCTPDVEPPFNKIPDSSNQNSKEMGPANQNNPSMSTAHQNGRPINPSNQNSKSMITANQSNSSMSTANQNGRLINPSNQNSKSMGTANQSNPSMGTANENNLPINSPNQNSKSMDTANKDNPSIAVANQNNPSALIAILNGKLKSPSERNSAPIIPSLRNSEPVGASNQNNPSVDSTNREFPMAPANFIP